MSEVGIGKKYAEDFLEFILKNVKLHNEEKSSVLEIGCGAGYLLHRLQKLEFRVLGIDPGKHGQVGARKYGVEIIHDTFPAKMNRSKRQFDIIIHYTVLEHIERTIKFLKKQAEYLSESGLIIFAVPNCEEYILKGDISIFLHEHWNYFRPYSLKKVMEKAGLQLLHIENARYGGALYGIAGKVGQAIDIVEKPDWIQQFKNRVQQSSEKTKVFFQKCMEAGHSVGIFCPGRAINLLHHTQPKNVVRFFDDDELLHGKYYPPFDIPVESRQSLIKRPVDDLIIMSSSFGEMLRSELLQEDILKHTNIVQFREIIDLPKKLNENGEH